MKSLNEQAADLLESAGAVLWLPEWWTQNTLARDSDGVPTPTRSGTACRFCASGALSVAGRNMPAYDLARFAVRDITGGNFVAFNDRARSSKPVAIAMFRAADQLRRAV